MQLLTDELRKKIPAMGSQEGLKDPMIVAKFFTPWSSWTWYIIEFDGEDTFFAYVDGLMPELGYVSLSELEDLVSPSGLRIERDLHWIEMPLSAVKKEVEG
ncbi:MAG: DUF2958 domain-containing protein [Candidatus Methanoperedens sp.]|nr:DUF2958 domain-containing protein [Candidatus Methanoperedens sp.]